MGLHNRVCDILEIDVPIVLAGMGGASTPRLAAAVSNAGGLGILGAAACSPKELRSWIEETRSLTDRPFGVDTLLPASVRRGKSKGGQKDGPSPMEQIPTHQEFARKFLEAEGLEEPPPYVADPSSNEAATFTKGFFDAQMEVVIEEKVPVYAAGLGNPAPWMDRMRANGTKVLAVVGAVRHARQVAETGIDIIVAQGHDAGGHNSPIGTMALVPQVVDAVGGIPVLAAGGITDGRGIAASFMLGAEGAWIGSAFLATEEAGLFDYQKQAIVDATDEGTTVSRSITGKPARQIKNRWAQAYATADIDPLPMPFQSFVSSPIMQAAMTARRGDIWPGFAGQGIGMIKQVVPAADLLKRLVQETETVLAKR